MNIFYGRTPGLFKHKTIWPERESGPVAPLRIPVLVINTAKQTILDKVPMGSRIEARSEKCFCVEVDESLQRGKMIRTTVFGEMLLIRGSLFHVMKCHVDHLSSRKDMKQAAIRKDMKQTA